MLSVVRITMMVLAIFSAAAGATDGSLNIEGNIINGTCKVEGVVIDPDEGGSGVPSPNIDFEFASHVFIDGDTQSTNQTGDVRFFIRLAQCQATAKMQNVRPRFLTSGTLDSGGRLINMDKNGPTAVLKSVSKLRTEDILGGVLLNQKVNPQTLAKEEDKQKLIMLLRAFFNKLHGYHIQYNVVSRETLIDAQKHPEKHRDLIVRVAGYSAFFNVLSKATQDDIIERTEHII